MSTDDLSFGPDDNIGTSALTIIWTFIGITAGVVAARTWSQVRIMRMFGLADMLMILSIITIAGMASLITVQYHYGWGRHFIYLDLEQQTQALKFNFIGQSFGVMGSTWGRMSYILLMLNLYGTTKRQRNGFWALFWAQLFTNGIMVIIIYAQCKNVKSLWDFSFPGECWSPMVETDAGYIHTVFNGVSDLFLSGLSARFIWGLKLPYRLKLGLAILLGLSFFAFVAVIMKLITIGALSNRGDYTYNIVPFFLWVIIEGLVVDITSSIPLLRPLFKRQRENFQHTQLQEMIPAGSSKKIITKETTYKIEYDIEKTPRLAITAGRNSRPISTSQQFYYSPRRF